MATSNASAAAPDLFGPREELAPATAGPADSNDNSSATQAAGGKKQAIAARVAAAGGRFEAAITLFNLALAAEPDNRPWIIELGRLLSDIGDHQLAVEQYERALALEWNVELQAMLDAAVAGLLTDLASGLRPSHKRRHRRALEHLLLGEPAAAEPIFAMLTDRDPSYAPGWAGLRGALMAQGRADEACKVGERWTAAHPESRPVIGAVMARPLSPRGLMFDPREPLPLRWKEQVLAPAGSSVDLRRTPESYAVLDPGGRWIKVRPPIPLGDADQGSRPIRYETGPSFVVSLDAAAVVGRGAVVSRNGDVIAEVFRRQSAHKYGATVQGETVRFDVGQYKDGRVETTWFDRPAFLLCGPTDRSYGEWINNHVPRLALAEAAGLDCAVVVAKDAPRNYLDMLAALGVGRDRLLLHDPDGVSVFPRLYAPSWPHASRTRPMEGWYDVYRRATVNSPPEQRPLLYLSRRSVPNRVLVNENQIADLFQRRGFELVCPEDLSFDDMRRRFAAPACVAGPYGSAFRNLVFCHHKPVALALMPPYRKDHADGVAIWLGHLGVPFARLDGAPVGWAAGDETPNTAPWTIPLDEVDRALDRVLGVVATR